MRALARPPSEDMVPWLKFSAICRRAGRPGLALRALERVWDDSSGRLAHAQLLRAIADWRPVNGLAHDTPYHDTPLPLLRPRASVAQLKLAWSEGAREAALGVLLRLGSALAVAATSAGSDRPPPLTRAHTNRRVGTINSTTEETAQLRAKVARRAGLWQHALGSSSVALQQLQLATQHAPLWHKAWQSWAMAPCFPPLAVALSSPVSRFTMSYCVERGKSLRCLPN